MKVFSKRTWVVLGLIAAVAALASVGAYAYFTAAGSGTGTASVGAATGITITSDNQSADLYPGGGSVSVDVHVTNPGSGQQFVDDVSGSVADSAGCLGGWFTVATIDANQNIAPGATYDTSTTVTMADTGTNQNACQNADLTINWVSN